MGQTYKFDHITIADGLSQSTVEAILRDSRGLMWFGTNDGLNCYNGYDLTVYRYKPAQQQSLSDNYIFELLEDRQGYLWVGTSDGLNCYNPTYGTFVSYRHNPGNSNSVSHNIIHGLAEDRFGNLWIGTLGGGVDVLDPQRTRFLHLSRELPGSLPELDARITHLMIDRQDQLWICTFSGMIVARDVSRDVFAGLPPTEDNMIPPDRAPVLRFHAAAENSAENIIWSACQDSSGAIWFAASQIGLSLYQPATNRFLSGQETTKLTGISADQSVHALMTAPDGTIWAGTEQEGLYLFHPRRGPLAHIDTDNADPQSLNDHSIWAIYGDAQGIIWIGTEFGGVNKIAPYRLKFAHLRLPETRGPNASGVVWALSVPDSNHVWVGTDGQGLLCLDQSGRLIQEYTHQLNKTNSLSDNTVTVLLPDGEQGFWVGTNGGGVNRLHLRFGVRSVFQANSPPPRRISNNSVKAMCRDNSDGLWIGTYGGGLNYLNTTTEQVTPWKTGGGSSDVRADFIAALMWSFDDELWIGTYSDGVVRFKPRTGAYRNERHRRGQPGSISSNRVYSLFQSKDSTIWIGTAAGLNRYDPGPDRFTAYHEDDGLPNEVIYAMLEDNRGDLWVSTNHGLSRFNRQANRFDNFSVANGLQGFEFNRGAAYKSADGRLYVGGVNGFNVFQPSQIRFNPTPPPVILTDLRVMNKRVQFEVMLSALREVHLSYQQNVFSFEFAALDFTEPHKNQYAYKLEGFDQDWVFAGHRRYVSYTDLSPGRYVFRVKASNNDGVWNERGVSLPVIVEPPFWLTWWFRTFVLLLVAGVLYAIYRIRLWHLLGIERTRIRIASDLHDEVSGSLSSINWFARAIQAKRQSGAERGEDFLKLIIASATDAQEKIKDIIWAINPEYDSWEILFAKCQRYASDLFESHGIVYQIEFESPPDNSLDMVTRHQFWLVFKEIVTNVIRHSHCDRVDIRITQQRRGFLLFIRDDGIGFDPEHVQQGNGIQNIWRRCGRLRASCSLESAPGKGTCWSIRME